MGVTEPARAESNHANHANHVPAAAAVAEHAYEQLADRRIAMWVCGCQERGPLRNPRTMPTSRAGAVSQPITWRVGTRATARKANLRALVVSLGITVVLQEGEVIAHHDSSPALHPTEQLVGGIASALVLLRRHVGHVAEPCTPDTGSGLSRSGSGLPPSRFKTRGPATTARRARALVADYWMTHRDQERRLHAARHGSMPHAGG
jgi:hypothetical protein